MPDSMSAPKPYGNLLEPFAFADLFLRCPPASFTCSLNAQAVPVFHTDFDLLTTLENNTRARLAQLPLFARWSRWLTFATCFVGTTITEYAPIPKNLSPATLIRDLLHVQATQALTIIKDLPEHSPLLSEEENLFADNLALEALAQGCIVVQGQALAYVPIDFADMDVYMARLSSGRRKNIRRKMKTRTQLTIETLPLGDARFEEQAFLDELYAMYMEVYEQSEIHFDLLSRDFFAALLQSQSIPGFVFCYSNGAILAGYNICLIHNNRLIDKYIGFKYPLARKLNLYTVSWMFNLEFALEHGLETYVAGWTDPEVKAGLGADFSFTRHLVWVKNPVLRHILHPLRRLFEADRQTLADRKKAS